MFNDFMVVMGIAIMALAGFAFWAVRDSRRFRDEVEVACGRKLDVLAGKCHIARAPSETDYELRNRIFAEIGKWSA